MGIGLMLFLHISELVCLALSLSTNYYYVKGRTRKKVIFEFSLNVLTFPEFSEKIYLIRTIRSYKLSCKRFFKTSLMFHGECVGYETYWFCQRWKQFTFCWTTFYFLEKRENTGKWHYIKHVVFLLVQPECFPKSSVLPQSMDKLTLNKPAKLNMMKIFISFFTISGMSSTLSGSP